MSLHRASRRKSWPSRPSSPSGAQGGQDSMLDFIQQLVSGVALGCVYGLIALGFVLIYKTTEVVNFAQGDLMMLGGFFAYTYIGLLGLNYWVGFVLAVLTMGVLGMVIERLLIRPVLGYPQFAIVMATIGLGFFVRSLAGMIWGTDDLKIDTPFSNGVTRSWRRCCFAWCSICSSTRRGSARRCGRRPRTCWPPTTWAFRSSG
jgi:branched-subunit amino acid ABC-type transport system permease component